MSTSNSWHPLQEQQYKIYIKAFQKKKSQYNVFHIFKKITLTESVVFANGEREKQKAHRLVRDRYLKKCEIKQLPNCWPKNLSKYLVSPFFSSLLFLLSDNPICLLAHPSVSLILARIHQDRLS